MARPIRPSRGSVLLARRLRELRERSWPDRPVTQKQLADAFGGLSVGTISGYENERNPTTPPPHRLLSYATFFATRRSIAGSRVRLVPDEELNPGERAEQDRLFAELQSLTVAEQPERNRAGDGNLNIWKFPENEPVRIVCGRLKNMNHPYADSRNPNYTELLSFADLDAFAELYAHVWRLNPSCDIRYRRTDELRGADDLGSHLVLLGGNGLNRAVQQIVSLTSLPVRQVDNDLVEDGDVFSLGDDFPAEFLPEVTDELGLIEDTGLFARLINPFNSARTLTLCSGVYSGGVYGAVRTLTDNDRRERNEAYLAQRFAGADQFAILMRVKVLLGSAVTPDLENPDVRLYEWPDAASGGSTDTGERRTGER
jgi:transcriptional regulator with XRE-family HTH domain